ncbi:MAG: hypothetical protein U0935_16190 [Pirellulales bacterium]
MSQSAMSQSAVAQASRERRGRQLITVWLVGLCSVTLLACLFLGGALRANRQQAERRHEERMNPAVLEAGAVAADVALPPGVTPVEVRVGVYVERVVELSVRDTSWTVDFDVWFRWRDPRWRPGDTFEVVDGWIEQREKTEEYVTGDEHYERYRVVARISKFFDVTRFPVEEHLLTISLELAGYTRDQVILVADEAQCGVSSRVHIPAFQIARQAAVEKPHAYQSSLGDPRLRAGHRSLRSQFRYGIWLRRDGWGFGWKLFQGIYASLAVALAALFIKPTAVDPRFGLGVGAFFTSIANSYITSSLVPDTGIVTLADLITGLGLALIFLTIVQSIVSLYIHDRLQLPDVARRFDRVACAVLATAALLVNVVIPLAARG